MASEQQKKAIALVSGDQTKSHDPVSSEEDPTIALKSSEDDPTHVPKSSEENPTLALKLLEEDPTLAPKSSEEDPTLAPKSSEEDPTLAPKSSEEDPTLASKSSEEVPTFVLRSSKAVSRLTTESLLRPAACTDLYLPEECRVIIDSIQPLFCLDLHPALLPDAFKRQSHPLLDSDDGFDEPAPSSAKADSSRRVSIVEDEDVLVESSSADDGKTEQFSRMKKDVSSSEKAATLQDEDAEPQQPIFSSSWQFSETFTSNGGQLQAMDSDVILTIPEKAVNDGSGEEPRSGLLTNAAVSMCTVGSKATGLTEPELFTPAATSQRQETISAEPAATAGVTIHGAITTDVKGVHEKLKLTATESICSPVVEYYAGENFMFKKPVCISLPHFLPPDVNENDVRVYQVNRTCNEEICSEPLWLVSKLEEIHASGAVDAERVTGTFHLTEENRIIIVTNHFTGYFCTHCKQQMDPPHLQFRLYATEIEKKTGDVDLTMLIWDLRLGISDFRKPWAPDSKDEMAFITSTKLERLRNENVDDVRVGVWIRFPPTETDEPVWMHKSRPDGTPWLKPNRSFDLQVFFPCLCHTEPERVEWSIQCGKDPVQLQRSECYMYVDVGYVKQDRLWSDFLETQDTSTIRVSLKMKENSCTHSAVPVSSQAPVPMETGTPQDEMTNHELSNSRSCVSNLLHGPNSLPASYHPAQSLRPQEQPTFLERGHGQNTTVVNIAKVVANKVDLASLLHPQENGMESYFEQGMITATRTSQNELASDRVAADQNGEETARKSLTSSAWQGARPKKKKKTKPRKSHCIPSGQCPTQPMRFSYGNKSNGEDINQVTQAPMETVGNAPQELLTSSTRFQRSENRSFELKCPVPCSADVSGTHTNGDNVSGSRNAMLEAL